MTSFTPKDPDFEQKVRDSFASQPVMAEIGAVLRRVEPGEVEVELPYRTELTQQHGFIHAGILATILDNACGYAAFSLMPAAAEVLAVEFKLNLLAPAMGDAVLAIGTVLRPGRTLTACRGDAFAVTGGQRKRVAAMQATMMTVLDRPDVES
ncbi:MAG: PaaI family thioesterase [Deltaproteobacteria bacterium]|nr:PaaI family thioesterase [Deltaproteobacteria bacterium]